MAKLTTTDVYGILTAHSNTILKNDVSIAGNLSIAGNILSNGAITATTFSGNGSALTGISPSAIVTLSGTSVTISQITAPTMFTVDASLNANQTVDITAGANSKYTVIFQNPSSYLSTITLKTGVTYVLNPMNTLMLSYDGTQWEIINSPSGAAISNWTTYTPTVAGFGTNPTSVGLWRRVGSDMEVKVRTYVTNITGATTFSVSMPSGYSIDTSKLTNTVVLQGRASWTNILTGLSYTGTPYNLDANTFNFYGPNITGPWNATVPTNLVANVAVSMEVMVPIVGWGSNINLVSDFTEYAYNTQSGINTNGTSATYAQGPAGANIVANTAQTYYDVLFLTPVKSTDEVLIDICEGGFWALSQNRLPYGTEGASINRGIRGIWVSSTVYRVYFSTYSEGLNPWSVFAALKWRVRKISNGNFAEVPSIPHLEVYGNSGQTSVSSVSLTVIFLTVLVDSHNGYNPATGIYTAPQSGYYQVNVGMMFNYDAWAVSPDTTLVVVGGISNKNVVYKTIPVNAALAYVDMGGSTTIKCVAGAQIYTIVSHTSGSNKSLFPNAYGPYTYMDITWLGK